MVIHTSGRRMSESPVSMPFPAMRFISRNNIMTCDIDILQVAASEQTEVLLRTYHPILRGAQVVRVYQNPHCAEDTAWVLEARDAPSGLYVDRIGGRRLFFLPDDYIWWIPLCPNRLQYDPYWAHLQLTGQSFLGKHPPSDPRKTFSQDALKHILSQFPGSVGLRIFVYGVIAVLFNVLPDANTLAGWAVPSTIAGMRYLMLPLRHQPITVPNLTTSQSSGEQQLVDAPTVHTIDQPLPFTNAPNSVSDVPNRVSDAPSDAPNPQAAEQSLPSGPPATAYPTKGIGSTQISASAYDGTCSLGLHLRFPDGKEALTTVAHGFAARPLLAEKTRTLNVVSTLMRTAASIAPLRLQRMSEVVWTQVARLLGYASASPVGTRVYMALSSCCPRPCFGRVGHVYDSPSSILPYPSGYIHDLALIVPDQGSSLPMLWWTSAPRLTGFSTFETVLANPNAELFCIAPHLVDSGPWPPPSNPPSADMIKYDVSFGLLAGKAIPESQRPMLPLAREYLWEDHLRRGEDGVIKETLLWRSEAVQAKAQNADMQSSTTFQGASGAPIYYGKPLDSTATVVCFQCFESNLAVEPALAYHGGFSIPADIKKCTIEPGQRLQTITTSVSAPLSEVGENMPSLPA
ncbi:hypothetical protein GGX14DRAFT_441861 [Mycena pura]|uniref:Uncharacterized protein n=1 Tax=Mycena pura TaxID=153505 RepID=A0AAD6VLM5_9AGAR|nr:hypothetical protein GGX14DRAFT_441861 [Mycena pura]